MKFSRRNFVKGVGAGAITLATHNAVMATPPAPLAAPKRRATATSALPSSKRSVINLNSLDVFEYAFIDHCRQGDQFPSPIGANYANSPIPWTQLLDSD